MSRSEASCKKNGSEEGRKAKYGGVLQTALMVCCSALRSGPCENAPIWEHFQGRGRQTHIITRGVRCLKLLLLDVPSTADMFSPVTLWCEYDTEGFGLYSVKWYKDGSEFFRYMPDYDPPSKAVKSSEVTVDLQKSGMNKVTLINLQFNNSGNYKCEVSTEGPNFETVAKDATMTVVAYPTEDPLIEGVLSAYSIGDQVVANCTSGKSNPQATLTWRINGVESENRVWDYSEGSGEVDSQGLHTRTLGLSFQIHNSHFSSNAGGLMPRLEIRCTSVVGTSVRHNSVYPTIIRALTSNKLAQERLANTASKPQSSLTLAVLLVSSLWRLMS